MSQKRHVQPERSPLRRAGLEGAAALTDPALTPGRGVNGASPLLAAGDDLTSVAVVRCWCRDVLGVVWLADRSARGMGPLQYLVGQIVEDRRARPPLVREYRQRLSAGGEYLVECSGHGRGLVPGSELLAAARKTLDRLAAGDDTPAAVRVSKSGRGRMVTSKSSEPRA